MKFGKVLFFTLALIVSIGANAFTVPKLTGPIVDLAQVIQPTQKTKIETLIYQLQDAKIAQIAVLTVPNLQGEEIAQASIQVTDQWKLGTAKADNGVLILFSNEDRKVRIEVGQGLEGVLPDIYARRIISDVMIPYFKMADYSYGLYAGVVEVASILNPNFSGQKISHRPSERKTPSWIIIVAFIIFSLFRGLGYRRRSFLGGGYTSGGWGSGGFGGGGFGGGGGFSGGGGGFSGGGSSGSW